MQDSVRKIAHCLAKLNLYIQYRQNPPKNIRDDGFYGNDTDSETAKKDDGCPESTGSLFSRYERLCDKNTALQKLPDWSCQSHDFFLKDNLDFFIGYLMIRPNENDSSPQIQAFVKHLNDCYWCFSYYSAFFKYYEIERRAIKQRYHTRLNADDKNGGGHHETV